MNEHKYHYLYTTFDIDAFDLDDFKYNSVNITAFRLVDVDDIGVREILKDIRRFQQQQSRPSKDDEQSKSKASINNNKFIEVIFMRPFCSVMKMYLKPHHRTKPKNRKWKITAGDVFCCCCCCFCCGCSLIYVEDESCHESWLGKRHIEPPEKEERYYNITICNMQWTDV